MIPKLLSPEELEAARIWFGSAGPNGANGRLLLAHIAALEADHAKALVRARNEGLEKAARYFDEDADSTQRYADEATTERAREGWAEQSLSLRCHATHIRALKENEE